MTEQLNNPAPLSLQNRLALLHALSFPNSLAKTVLALIGARTF